MNHFSSTSSLGVFTQPYYHSICNRIESLNNIDAIIEHTPKKNYNTNQFPLIINSSHLLKNDKENSFMKGNNLFEFGQQDSNCNLDHIHYQGCNAQGNQMYPQTGGHQDIYNYPVPSATSGCIPHFSVYDCYYDHPQYGQASGAGQNAYFMKTPMTGQKVLQNIVLQQSGPSFLKAQNSEIDFQQKKEITDFSYGYFQGFKQPNQISHASENISDFTAGEQTDVTEFNNQGLIGNNKIEAFSLNNTNNQQMLEQNISENLPASNQTKRVTKKKSVKKQSIEKEQSSIITDIPKISQSKSIRKKSVSSTTTVTPLMLPLAQKTQLYNNNQNEGSVHEKETEEDNSENECLSSQQNSESKKEQENDIHNENSDQSESEDKKKQSDSKPCNCRNSKCLKRYCDCFAAGLYCTADCKCEECHNTPDYEEERQKAIQKKKKRIKDAFQPVILNNTHIKGCHCKNSHCQKKYCVCHQNGVLCSSLCQCVECENKIAEMDKQNQNNPPSNMKSTLDQEINSTTILTTSIQQNDQVFNLEDQQMLIESPQKCNNYNDENHQMEIELLSTAKKEPQEENKHNFESEFSTHKKPVSKRKSFRGADKQKALSFINEISMEDNIIREQLVKL